MFASERQLTLKASRRTALHQYRRRRARAAKGDGTRKRAAVSAPTIGPQSQSAVSRRTRREPELATAYLFGPLFLAQREVMRITSAMLVTAAESFNRDRMY
jgi:hypothetical protein